MDKEKLKAMNSRELAAMIDECKHMIISISDPYTEALSNYNAMKELEEVVLSELVVKFHSGGLGYNISLRYAEASEEFKDFKNRKIVAFDELKPLEIRHKAFVHIIDAIQSLAYVLNTEIKKGI